jgi:hypothetical protein
VGGGTSSKVKGQSVLGSFLSVKISSKWAAHSVLFDNYSVMLNILKTVEMIEECSHCEVFVGY